VGADVGITERDGRHRFVASTSELVGADVEPSGGCVECSTRILWSADVGAFERDASRASL
jgi:hypothetical protein